MGFVRAFIYVHNDVDEVMNSIGCPMSKSTDSLKRHIVIFFSSIQRRINQIPPTCTSLISIILSASKRHPSRP